MTSSVIQDRYKGWLVEFDHPPIPCRNFDWVATHPLYDPENPDGSLLLEAATRNELVAAIDAWTDDAAVDAFADKMKAKMGESRVKGREGWNDPARCSPDTLVRLMYAHAEKGDPVDVANFCMMLDHYGASTAIPAISKLAMAADAHEFMRTLEPVRTADDRGNPGLLYTAQNTVDAFKAGAASVGCVTAIGEPTQED